MSIATELTRIQTAKSNLRQSIINKGGTVASDALLGAYSTAVDNLPSGGQDLDYLSSYTLDGWGRVMTATIRSGITSIPDGVFRNNTSLTSLSMPDTINTIGQLTFDYCSSLTSITIPDGVTSIGSYAFRYCTGLTSINIPSGLTSIENNYIFDGCSSLTSVTIPNGVRNITGYYVFSNCTSLKNVTIESSVESIGSYMFNGCSSLSSITCYATTAPTLGISPFGGVKPTGILYYPYGSDFSSWIRILPTGWTAVEFEDGYRWVDDGDNYICSGTTKYQRIKEQVTLDGGSTWQDVNPPVYQNGAIVETEAEDCGFEPYLYYKAKLILPNNSKAYIPINSSSVLTSSETSRYKYSGVTDVVIYSAVTSVGQEAFREWSGLTSVNISDGVTSIGAYAFYADKKLSSVTIPDSVTVIDQNAFKDCSGLTSATIGSGVTSFGTYAFQNCSGLTSITIPNGVTNIGQQAFSNCVSLTSITIPGSVTSFGTYVFSNCSGLTSVTIESGITSIITGLLSRCYSLSSITIPDSVTSIGQYAFEYCSGLTTAMIGSGITNIGDYTFNGCSSLSSITCYATTAPTLGGKRVFLGVKGNGVLYYPYGSNYSTWLSNSSYYLGYYNWTGSEMQNEIYQWVDDGDNYICSGTTKYQRQKKQVSTDGGTTWTDVVPAEYQTGDLIETDSVDCGYVPTDYKAKVTLDDDSIVYIPSDGTSALTYYDVNQYANSAVEMEINSSITSVGGCAMMTGLTTLIIPNSVTDIDGEAFMDCTSLSSVTIPDSVTGMGDSAFFECSGLTSATIGSGVTQFNGWTFMNCTSLSSITSISSTAPTLGSMDFNNVASTGTLYTPNGGNYNAWMSALPNGWSKSSPLDNSKAKLILNDDSVVYIPLNGSSALTSGETSQYISTAVDVEIGSGVTGLSNAVFSGFTNLESIVIGDNVRTIGVSAFTWDSSLSSVTLGNSVTGLSDVAFGGCSGIQTITIPNSMRSIGNSCFDTCTSLTTITIPSGVTNMGVYCFHNCTSLSSITIGSGISTINNYMFCGDTSLSSITCERTTAPTVGDNVFNNLPTNGILNVPQGANYSSWLNRLPSGWSIPQTAQYRWVDYEADPSNVGSDFTVYAVNGNNGLYSLEKQQISTDGGTTWSDVSPLNTRFNAPIEDIYPAGYQYVAGNFYMIDVTSEDCQYDTVQVCDDDSYNNDIASCEGDPDCEAQFNYDDYCYDDSQPNGYIDREWNIYTSTNSGSTWTSSQIQETQEDRCFCLGECGGDEPEPYEEPADPEPSE